MSEARQLLLAEFPAMQAAFFSPTNIQQIMAQPTKDRETNRDEKNPNFLMVVIISAVALLIIFVGAYFVVGDKGRKLVPPRHQDPQPTSELSYPNSPNRSIAL